MPSVPAELGGFTADTTQEFTTPNSIGEDHRDQSYGRSRLSLRFCGDLPLRGLSSVHILDQGRDISRVGGQRPRAGDLGTDLALGRDDDGEGRALGIQLDVVQCEDVGRVGARDPQMVAVLGERHHEQSLADRTGQHAGDVRQDMLCGQVHEVEVQHERQGLGHLALGAQPEVNHHLAESASGTQRRGLLGQRCRQAVAREGSSGDEGVTEAPPDLGRLEVDIDGQPAW